MYRVRLVQFGDGKGRGNLFADWCTHFGVVVSIATAFCRWDCQRVEDAIWGCFTYFGFIQLAGTVVSGFTAAM